MQKRIFVFALASFSATMKHGLASENPYTFDPANVAITNGTISGATVDGSVSTAAGGTTPRTLASHFSDNLNALDFGVSNGVTDETANLQAAINAVHNAGGGTLEIPASQYAVGATTSLLVRAGVILKCDQPVMGNYGFIPYPYSSQPYTFYVSPNNPVIFEAQSGSIGCNFIASSMRSQTFSQSNTMRQEIDIQQAFAGTGIEIVGYDVMLENLFIGGFNTGIYQESGRLKATNINVDANECINSTGSGDNTYLENIHCMPLMAQGTSQNINTWTIGGAANNGSGLYRITVSSTTSNQSTALSSLEAGDTVYINAMSGAQSANNKFVVAAVGSNYIDLTGSSTSGVTPTGSTLINSYVVTGLSSMTNIGVGDTIAGTGIPSSTTVAALWPEYNAIVLSNRATSTNAGETLTIADTAYVSGGTLSVDTGQRSGDGFSFSNSTGTMCDQCFELGHPVGFDATTGMAWLKIRGSTDNDNVATYPGEIGLLVEQNAKGVEMSDGWLLAYYTPVVVNTTTAADPTIVADMTLDTSGNGTNGSPGSHFASIDQGRAVFIGNAGSNPGSGTPDIFIADQPNTHLTLDADDLQNGFYFQDAAAVTNLNQGAGITRASSGSTGGSMALPAAVAIGGASGACDALSSTCGLTVNGPEADISEAAVWMSNGGTDASFPTNATSRIYNGSGTLSSYTIDLPTPSTASGQELNLYFSQAVTAMTWSGNSELGLPASPAANSWHKCQSYSSIWYCN